VPRAVRVRRRIRDRLVGRARSGTHGGFTLVEILVAVAILGIAIVGIVGAIATFLHANTIDRSVANLDQVVRTYSESMNGQSYVSCASSYSSVTLPTGYTFSAGPTIMYWNGDNPATFAASCGTDNGVQQISATISQTASAQTQSILIVKNSG
jgi:prepilin-type N-terminal cleavage/methylation domain-containing protein